MFTKPYIEHNKEIINEHLKEKYSIDVNTLPSHNDFIEACLYGISSLKIWNENLVLPEDGPVQYLKETISNLNQVALIGPLGFQIPTCMLLRRSLENTFIFLYYKDHPIEYYLRDNYSKKFSRDSFRQYFQEYPFEMILEGIDKARIKRLIKKVLNLEEESYKELSNYVHATNSEYLDLKYHLDDLKPTNSHLNTMIPLVKNVSTIINSFSILFFYKEYFNFIEDKKEIIRFAIANDQHFKKDFMHIFGEI